VALLLCAAPVFPLAQTPPAKSSSSSTPSTPVKKKSKSSKKRAARVRAQNAPTPERIREIQSALAAKGCYEGEPTGKWDARTVEAMKKFQSENELTVTGKLDAKSLQKLGLGSEVAGSARPRPPANGNKPEPPRPQ
jgi:peptidoglycan hydrolase-like protein with peptidoglycan-binding domain